MVAVLVVFALGVFIGLRKNRSKGYGQDPSTFDKPHAFVNVAYQDAFYEQPVSTNPDYVAAERASEGLYDTYEAAGDESSPAAKNRVRVDSDNYVESSDVAFRGNVRTDTTQKGQYQNFETRADGDSDGYLAVT